MPVSVEKDLQVHLFDKDFGIDTIKTLYERRSWEESYKYYSLLMQVDLKVARKEVEDLSDSGLWSEITRRHDLDTNIPKISPSILKLLKQKDETKALEQIRANHELGFEEAYFLYIKIIRNYPEFRQS